MANITWALQFPQRLDDKAVSDLKRELEDMRVSMVDVYQVGDVPEWAPDEGKSDSYLYTAGGIESVFWGNPPESFDFEARLRDVFGNAIISSGTKHDTGERLWVARSYYFFPAGEKEIRRQMEASALAAMVTLDMHRMGAKNTGSQFSAGSTEKKPGLNALLITAGAYGIRSRIFCNGSGVPYLSEKPQPYGFRVRLVEGTEVLAGSDIVVPELIRLRSEYDGMSIHAAFPFEKRSA